MSSAMVLHMERVFSIVRKIYDRSPTDNLDDLDVNTAILGDIYEAAIHLGQDKYGEFTIYQESAPEVCETVIPK